jgi:hypothetical protein
MPKPHRHAEIRDGADRSFAVRLWLCLARISHQEASGIATLSQDCSNDGVQTRELEHVEDLGRLRTTSASRWTAARRGAGAPHHAASTAAKNASRCRCGTIEEHRLGLASREDA